MTKLLKLTARDAATLAEAVNEAINAQSFYLQVCRDDADDRSDAEIEDQRTLFERLQAKLAAQGI